MSIFHRFFDAAAKAEIARLRDDLAEERIRSQKLAAKLDVAKLRADELAELNEAIRQGVRANIAANVQVARLHGAPDPLPEPTQKRRRLMEDAG